MTKLSHVLGLALLVMLILCVAIVLTGGHPDTILRDIGDLYHRITD